LDILTITKTGVGDFITVPHPSPDTGFFSWTPDLSDTLNSPYLVTFIVDDGTGLSDTGEVSIRVKSQAGPVTGNEGDLNGDGKIDVSDAIFLINFLFKGGPEPNPPSAGDLNCDCVTTVSDIIYLINRLFRGGPPPQIRCNPGDVDYDGYINIPDVIYFINYLFQSGPAPRSMKSTDINADCAVDIVDLVYLINFLFRGGPIPLPGCVGCDGSSYKDAPPALAEVEFLKAGEGNELIEIPVRANFGVLVAGVQILVEFDPEQFEPVEPVLTERSLNLALFSSNKGNHQIIGLLDVEGQFGISPGSGSIVILRFKPWSINYDLQGIKILEVILADREANTLQTTIK
ncbi:MAG: dockerin type I domain-containing protein, partial [candidate division Zixibacteria bacterium]|nr:dockerin type I domain-containing protein [candidate division Zixibacteria bacterium]